MNLLDLLFEHRNDLAPQKNIADLLRHDVCLTVNTGDHSQPPLTNQIANRSDASVMHGNVPKYFAKNLLATFSYSGVDE